MFTELQFTLNGSLSSHPPPPIKYSYDCEILGGDRFVYISLLQISLCLSTSGTLQLL